MKTSKKELLMPVEYYEDDNGREVIMIGMMHVADRSFYDDVRDILDHHPDHKVLFEGVGDLTEAERSALTPEKLKIEASFSAAKRLYGLFAVALNLASQSDMLKPDPRWINADISMFELIQRYNGELIDCDADTEKIFRNGPATPLVRWFAEKALMGGGKWWRRWLSKGNIAMDGHVLLDERNQIAIAKIAEVIPQHDIITTWGEAHLPGIRKGLEAMGFRRVCLRYLVAYRARGYSLWAALKGLGRLSEIMSEA